MDSLLTQAEARQLDTELRAAGYILTTESQKGPSTRPHLDYDWLGYWLICEGPRGRHRAHYRLSSDQQLEECHRFALGDLPFVPTPLPEALPAAFEMIEVTKASFDAYQRAAEGFEQQAYRAHALLKDVWYKVVELDFSPDQELRDGLDQYRQQYGADWALTEDELEEEPLT